MSNARRSDPYPDLKSWMEFLLYDLGVNGVFTDNPDVFPISQAKTFSVLVPAAMSLERVSLAQLGRAVAINGGIAVKHCIKRVDRFIGNRRIEPSETMQGLVAWLAKP